MKIISSKLSAVLLLLAFVFTACTVTTDDDFDSGPTDAKIREIDTGGWIYGDLVIEGSGFETDCAKNAVSLNNGTTTLSLDLIDCTASEITARIPEDAAPGIYNITAEIGGATFTAINGTDMEVDVKIRPVILSMSKTTMDDGETITIDGLHLFNTTTNPQDDAKVWIMGLGYTNTVSEITVDPDGNGATVIIDEGIPPGEYNFLLNTIEWSNEIVITIL